MFGVSCWIRTDRPVPVSVNFVGRPTCSATEVTVYFGDASSSAVSGAAGKGSLDTTILKFVSLAWQQSERFQMFAEESDLSAPRSTCHQAMASVPSLVAARFS